MNNNKEKRRFSFFSGQYATKIKIKKDNLARPLIAMLAGLGLKPNHLTVSSFIMVLFFPAAFYYSPVTGFIILCVHGILDFFDGSLARYLKHDSLKGEFLDMANDNIGFVIVTLSLIHFNIINGFWGAFYLCGYLLMVFFMLVLKARRDIYVWPIFRSKYGVYIAYMILVFFNYNLFPLFTVFFAIYMTVTDFFLFRKISFLY